MKNKCVKKSCKNKVYCFGFCKEHFNYYFKRKFKKHLRKNNLLEKSETLNVQGENKKVVKFLLVDLGRKLSVKFSIKARSVESFSLDTKAVKQLSAFMKKEDLNSSISFLECFKTEEIKAFAKIHKLKVSTPKFSKFESKLYTLMKDSLNRRPNIFECTYNMMSEFSKT